MIQAPLVARQVSFALFPGMLLLLLLLMLLLLDLQEGSFTIVAIVLMRCRAAATSGAAQQG